MSQNANPTLERTFQFQSGAESVALLGPFNDHLKYVRDHFSVKLVARGDTLHITGNKEEVKRVYALFTQLKAIWKDDHTPTLEDVEYFVEQTKAGNDLTGVLSDTILRTRWGEEIKPKTVGQRSYLDAIAGHDIVFAVGPSGTGKTYLAVALAISALKRGQVHRIILTRPAVEAGEELGFLPGDLEAKISPYLRPLYDAIFDMLPGDEVQKLIANGRIEVAPLAYMRGRTLNDSFVILDEAQNTTHTQMKMFLTRLGTKSKAIITGDITQVDLRRDTSSLKTVQKLLSGIEGISFVPLDKTDVVRHRLVREIIEAYENAEQAKAD
jgi:phosphate starvation-inducible PhoH-like protein